MIWLCILLLVGLVLIGWLAWWRACRYQPPPSPTAIELAAMHRAIRIRQMTNLAEDYMDDFIQRRASDHGDRRWPM